MKAIKQNLKNWWEKWSNFQPKQREAEKAVSQYDYVFFGGSAGPGKSYFLRKFPVKFLLGCYFAKGLRGVRAGLFCEDYPSLWDRHINRVPYEFPNWLGTYRSLTHEFVFDEEYGGGVIAFRNLDDPSKYMSAEFALVEVDELTKNPKETFDFLRMRKRWPGIERTKFVGASNPGGIGHDWVKQLWINGSFDPNEKEKDQFKFIPARLTDNKYLAESYWKSLDSLPEKLRKAYKDGNWDIFAGQYFSEWSPDKHVVFPFTIPEGWRKFRAYDHGRENPACCKWYAVDYDGRVWVYRELYQAGWNVDQIAKEINRLSEGESYVFSVADPSIFSRTGFVDSYGGQTIAESFARQGVMFAPASNRRVDGWMLLHQYMAWDEHTRPKIQYFNVCYNSIRTIPALIHSDTKPEDLDTQSEDHAADADRYFLMTLHEQASMKPLTLEERKLREMNKQALDFNAMYGLR